LFFDPISLKTQLNGNYKPGVRNAICFIRHMKRLQRLEFIFLYERFIARHNELNEAVMSGKHPDELEGLRQHVNELYVRIKGNESPADNSFVFNQAQ
jgi:hypothetical protein